MARIVISCVFVFMISAIVTDAPVRAHNGNTGGSGQQSDGSAKTSSPYANINESTSRFIRNRYSCLIGRDQSQRPRDADSRELQDINFAFAYLDDDEALDLIQGYDKEPKNEFNITEPLDYRVFLSSGKTFSPSVTTLLARKILVQDFNLDGKDDVFFLAAGNHKPPRKGFHNTILLSVSNGHKYSRVDGGSRISHGGGAGDFDQDGDVDVVVANGQQKTVQLLVNKGDGTFEAKAFLEEWQHGRKDHFYTAEVWDLDEDGALDIVLGTPEAGLVFFWGEASGKDNPKFSSKQRFSPDILKDRLPLDMAFADFDGDGHVEMAIIDSRIFEMRYRGWGITMVDFDEGRTPTITSIYDDDPQQNFHWHGWIDACDGDGDGDVDLSAQMIGNNDLRKYPDVGKIEWINTQHGWSQKIIDRNVLHTGTTRPVAVESLRPSEIPDDTTISKVLCKNALTASLDGWRGENPLWVSEAQRRGYDIRTCALLSAD